MANVVLTEVVVDVAKLEEAIGALNESKLAAGVVPLVEDKAAEQEAFFVAVLALFPKIDKGIIKDADVPPVVTDVFNSITDEKDKQVKAAAEAIKKPTLKAPAEKAENKKEKEGSTVEKKGKGKAAAGKATKKAEPKEKKEPRKSVDGLIRDMLGAKKPDEEILKIVKKELAGRGDADWIARRANQKLKAWKRELSPKKK